MAKPKEPRFFVDAPSPHGRWGLGIDWYRSLFLTKKRFCGEASPAYSGAPSIPGVASRMASVIPEAKIIYLVREPFGRLKSQYFMNIRKQHFSGTFREFVESYSLACDCSSYGKQYAEYRQFYPAERILLVETARLQSQRQVTLAEIFRFIGADDDFSSPLFLHKRHVGGMSPFPTALGRRVISSGPMKVAKKILHGGLYYHLENMVLRPFSMRMPATDLPRELEERVKAFLREDIAFLRKESGLALPSLSVQ